MKTGKQKKKAQKSGEKRKRPSSRKRTARERGAVGGHVVKKLWPVLVKKKKRREAEKKKKKTEKRKKNHSQDGVSVHESCFSVLLLSDTHTAEQHLNPDPKASCQRMSPRLTPWKVSTYAQAYHVDDD